MDKALKKYFLFFVGPTLAAFLIAFVIPFASGVYLSFCQFTTLANAKWVGFSNYSGAFGNSDFIHALGFSALFTVVSVIITNVAAFALALLLTRSIKGTNAFRTMIFMPNLIGGIVLGYIWQFLINGFLSFFKTTITADPVYGFWGLIVLSSWQYIGYMMVIFIAGIQNISTDIIEAATIDGAGPWTTLRKITIPLVMPSITITLFMTITNSFKMFDQNLALTAGNPSKKTAMVALDIFNTFYNQAGGRLSGQGQAKAMMFFLLVVLISLVQLAITRRREISE
jgi:raffinose/stachyose/melibiose transport system permease protein